jgi:hypothetical protein
VASDTDPGGRPTYLILDGVVDDVMPAGQQDIIAGALLPLDSCPRLA